MEEIIRARYSPSEWNIYGAQASDGDNWHHDSGRCRELLDQKLLPLCRYYAYVQVAEEEQNLWTEYTQLLESQFRTSRCARRPRRRQIYPVFRDLFKKEGTAAKARLSTASSTARPRTADRAPSDWSFELIERYHDVIRAHGAALWPRHLPEPVGSHHRRADDGRLRLGRHAGELPPLELRQGIHLDREEVTSAATWVWPTRSSSTPNPCISYLMEENTLAMQALVIAHAAYGHNSFLQGQLPVPHVDRCVVDHRLPGLCEELRRRLRRAPRASTPSKSCSTPATR